MFLSLLSVWHLFLKLLKLFTLQQFLISTMSAYRLQQAAKSGFVRFGFVFFCRPSLILPPLEKHWQDTICILICSSLYLCIKISSDTWIHFWHLFTEKVGTVASSVQSKAKGCSIRITAESKMLFLVPLVIDGKSLSNVRKDFF